MAIRSDELEKEVEVVVFDVGMDQDFALAIHETDVHLSGMEIDSAVELGGGSAWTTYFDRDAPQALLAAC